MKHKRRKEVPFGSPDAKENRKEGTCSFESSGRGLGSGAGSLQSPSSLLVREVQGERGGAGADSAGETSGV